MSLARMLEGQFRGDIRFRGAAYLEAERVDVARVTPDELYGLVRDGTEYETHLSRQDGSVNMYCSCASEGASGKKIACKHLWATVLAVDAGDYLSGEAREGHIPPFVSDDVFSPISPLIFDDEFEDELLSGETYMPRSTKTMESAPPKRKLKEWEQRLLELRQQMGGKEDGSSAAEREREIYFEVDANESRSVGALVIQTSQRQRRANGQWGKLKPLKLRPGRLGEIEHEDDRRILAYLTGGTPERSSWIAQQTEFQSAVYRYQVPFELCELILPRMCATGRTRLLDSSETKSPPLTWDDGEAWMLALVLDHGSEGHEAEGSDWQLVGELRRDEDRIPVGDLALLVPGGLSIHNETISQVNDFGAQPWVQLLNTEQPMSGPSGDEVELVDRLLDLPTLPTLELPEELKLEEIEVTPTPVLTVVTPKGRGWRQERLNGAVQFDYLGTRVPASSRQWAIVQREEGRCLLRDRGFEDQAWLTLQELGFRRRLDQRRSDHDVDIAVSDLGRAVRRLVKEGWQVQADGHDVRQPANLQLKIRSGIDWFELTGDIDFAGQTIGFPELLAALARKDNMVRLPDGSLGILPDHWAEQYGLLGSLGEMQEDAVRFSNTQAGLIDALLAARQAEVDVDADFASLRDRLKSFTGVKEVQEPEGFIGELRSYQREGLGWLEFLQQFGFGGCLADDMGLGKTIQVLAILQDRLATKKAGLPSLVVVPKSLIFNWVHEINRFTPNLRELEYTGLNRAELRDSFDKYDVILTTYGTLRRDIAVLKDQPFDYVILDEAQTIKNAASQVAKATRLLKANYRLAMSGTPIENHIGDLWSIFEFLNPGMLGRSSVFKLYATDSNVEHSQQALSQGLKPFVLRRTKKEVATELPDKFEETIFCEMGTEQRKLYDELRDHYRQSLLGMVKEQGLGKSKMHVLEALLRLRQAACHPGLLDGGTPDDASAKLDVLAPHLEELIGEGHKSLVFSQFTSMLAIVKKALDARGIKYAYLDGKTRSRKKVVDEFQNDPDVSVFLISLKAGGLGLNLTAAEYVFLLDPWWNPAVEAQAIDRAHRVGQTKQVFAYRLICKGTVEEKIIELQAKKRKLADAILEADTSVIKNLTTDDLELLLS